MEATGFGGGIMLAIAAALWLLYLLPNWFKNREYLATEKNAVRLQQTIRVLAETADVQQPARLPQPIQPAQPRRAPRDGGPVAVGVPVQPRRPDARLIAMRLRRTRAMTTLLLFLSVIVGIVQIVAMAAFGAVGASWFLLGFAWLGTAASIAALRRLATMHTSRVVAAPAVAPRTSLGHEPVVAHVATSWTPVPVPKPLYLSREVSGAAPVSRPAVDPVVELEAAAASAERALRSLERPPSIDKGTPAPSRFASMGIVDASATVTPDLDAVLARRRAAG